MAFSVGDIGVPVAFSAALPGYLARDRRLRLVDLELYGDTRTGIPRQSFYHCSTRLLRGDSPHAVARHQKRQATGAGHRRHNLRATSTNTSVSNRAKIQMLPKQKTTSRHHGRT